MITKQAKRNTRQPITTFFKLIRSYLQKLLSGRPHGKDDFTPVVKSLSGVVKDFNWKEAKKTYQEHLMKKYSSGHPAP